ncbi:peroxisome assembly protein 12 [Adelges cooleyi]|uniref:peroxisome assembly protein 12 n=1 Tax=Adelges cooleyi TaxID=133065 RepID=UPI00217F6B9A|nr:peroxisome assembly protein 12 [Adelges cooleyi]
MAEKAAHHTTTVVTRPSIFEVIAQENLSATSYPALKIVANFISQKNPEKLNWLICYFDEVFLVCNTICQYKYLKKYGGTFSENFYDLTRIPGPKNLKPPDNQIYINLALVVFVPYVRNKFDSYVEQLQTKYKLQLKEKLIIILNKCVYTVWEVMRLVYYLKYINGTSQTHSPLLDIAGMILTYKNVVVSNNQEQLDQQLSAVECVKNYLHYGLTHSLELGAFLMQFLNWWHSENLQSKLMAYPIPEQPKATNKHISIKNTNKCPLCINERKMPTALTVSGFVFCYKCLHKSLMIEPRCPVTKLPATMQDMVRIYSEINR